MADYRLSATLTANDRGLTSALRSAQKEVSKLAQGVGAVKNENLVWRVGVEGLDKIKRLQSMARGMKFSPIKVTAQDNASPKLSRIKEQLTTLAGRAHTIAVNVRTNGGEQLNRLKSNMNELASGMMLAGGVGVMGVAGVGYGLADTINTFKDFDYQMKRNKALFTTGMDATAAQNIYQQLTETARRYGSTMIYTNAEVGKALEYMALAGWDAQTSMKALPAVLNAAVASGEDLALVSDIITDDMTAMGYKAGTYVKNGMGDMVEATQHFSDVLLRTTLRSNTNFQQLGLAMKYAAPLAHSLGYNIEDVAIAMGLMANNGIKADQAGTGLRGVMLRMINEPKKTAAAMESLGLSMFDVEGKSKGLMATLMDVRAKLRGKDAESLLDFVEQMTGEQIGQRGEVADFLREEMAQNGGKLTDKSFAKLASGFSGTYALAPFLALMNSTDEDIQKLMTEIYQKSDGTGAEINREMMDTLQGDLKTIQSAWEDFQYELLNGKGADGLRNFLQAATSDINAFKNALKDGFDLGDVFGLLGNVVTQLKNKFLELDGIGSILAGGVLMVGLRKLLNMGLRVKSALGEIMKLGATSAPPPAKGLPASSVGTMNVKAGVVNLSGSVKGGTAAPASKTPPPAVPPKPAAAPVPPKPTAPPPPPAPVAGRFAGMRGAAGTGAAFAALFGVFDFMSARSMGQSDIRGVDEQISEQKRIYQELRDNGASQDQLNRQVSAIRDLETSRNDIIKQTGDAERLALAGATGSVAGAALGAAIGSLAGPLGAMFGGMVGGAIGQNVGESFGQMGNERQDTTPKADFWGLRSAEQPPSMGEFRRQQETTITPPRASVGEFRKVNDEYSKAITKQTTATAEQIKRFDAYDKYLKQQTGSTLFADANRDAAFDFYRNKAANLKPPEMPEFDFSSFFDGLFGVKRAAAAELNPEQLAQQAAMERGETIQPTMPDTPELGVSILDGLYAQLDGVGEFFATLGETIQAGFTSALEGASETLSTFGLTIQEGFTSAFTGVGEVFSGLSEQISTGLATAQASADASLAAIKASFDSGLQAIQSAWGALPGFFDGVFSGLGGAASAAGSAIMAGLTSVIGAVIGAWQSAAATISGIIAGIASAAAGVGSLVPSFGSNYKGTARFEGGFTEVNEHGGELMILPSGTKIYPHATTKALLREEIARRMNEQDGFADLGISQINFPAPEENFDAPDALPIPQMKFPTATDNSDRSTSNVDNSSQNVSVNFGGVNITSGMDFDEFLHELQKLFGGAVNNSIQF